MPLILPPLVAFFVKAYPEFKPLTETQDGIDSIENTMEKILCLSSYSDFRELKNDINNCSLRYPFFMLVAHYLVINGYGVAIGINKPNGLISSSSIDSVSVSYQTAPYNNNFDFFFGQTPYGMEYLAYIASITSVKLIN